MPNEKPNQAKSSVEVKSSAEAKSSAETTPQEPTRRLRYTRTPPSGPLAVSPEQVRILRFLVDCRFLSLPQLAGLLGLPEKSARRRLRVLFDAGLVDVIPVSRVALAPPDAPNDESLLFGSAPNIYAPTAAGIKLLVSQGGAAPTTSKKSSNYGPRNGLFLAHELAVRDVRVWLEVTRRHLEATGPQTDERPHVARWQIGQEAWIKVGDEHARWSPRPDAWFVYELSGGARPVILVGLAELDRGTERGTKHWMGKLQGYQELFAHPYALTDATGYFNARVLVFTPNAQRRDRLAMMLSELIRYTGFPADLLGRFWLADHSVLAGSDLSARVWRRPEVEALLPLVPPSVFRDK